MNSNNQTGKTNQTRNLSAAEIYRAKPLISIKPKNTETKDEKNKEIDNEKLKCDLCGNAIVDGKAKYVPKGVDMVMVLCHSCSGKSEKPKPVQTSFKNRKRFRCKRCEYEFRFDPRGSADLKCPYCGRADRLEEHIPVQDIIKGTKPDK